MYTNRSSSIEFPLSHTRTGFLSREFDSEKHEQAYADRYEKEVEKPEGKWNHQQCRYSVEQEIVIWIIGLTVEKSIEGEASWDERHRQS